MRESILLPPGVITCVPARFGRHVGTSADWADRNWSATAHASYPTMYSLASEEGLLCYGSGLPPKEANGYRNTMMLVWNRSPVTYRLPAGLPFGSVKFTKGVRSESRSTEGGPDTEGIERMDQTKLATWYKADGTTSWLSSGHEARDLTRKFNHQLPSRGTRSPLWHQ